MKSWEKPDLRTIVFLAGVILSAPAAAQTTSQEKESPKNSANKIEDLFLWKVSDELKLSTSEEKKFSELYKKLSKKKSDLAHAHSEMMTRLPKTEGKDLKTLLANYRANLTESNKLPIEEFDGIKKLLGEERLAKYLQVKWDLNNKVKALLSEKTEKKESELPPPKVIEE